MVAATHRVSEAEAAARLPELIDRVGAGEAVSIEREGRVVAALVPRAKEQVDEEEARRGAALHSLLHDFKGMFGDATLEEAISWKHEGHRHG